MESLQTQILNNEKAKDLKKLDKEKFLFVETIVRNRKSNVLYHGTTMIPERCEDYNYMIDRYGLDIKYSK